MKEKDVIKNICEVITYKNHSRISECDVMMFLLKTLGISVIPETINKLVFLKGIFSTEEIAKVLYNESIERGKYLNNVFQNACRCKD